MNTTPLDSTGQRSATETARLVRGRELSAHEVVVETLARIEKREPALGAVTHIAPDEALKAADLLDRRIASGEKVGPLAGVATLVKDLYGFVPGWPTTMGGLPALKDARGSVEVWSRYPRAVVDADAVLIGQTNSPAFGFRGVTDNVLFGPARNPFDLSRNAGGSSGGAAAAVAAGLVPVAGASDAGGSIRIPAAWTNTFGFQPTAGRVPSAPRPVGFHLGPFLYEGPVTRNVADAALVMNTLQGYDARDPSSVPGQAEDFTTHLQRGIAGMRIGFTPDFGGFPVEPEVRATIAEAVTVFEELGAVVEPIDLVLPVPHEELSRMWLRSLATMMLRDVEDHRVRGIDLGAEDGIPEQAWMWMDAASRMTMREVLDDRALRTDVLDAMARAQERVDLIVGPTVVALPVENGPLGRTTGPASVDGAAVDPLIGWCPTYLTNFSGAPSASVPAGLAGGLPVGLLVIGRPHRDGDVFAAAAAIEHVRPWQHLYPTMA